MRKTLLVLLVVFIMVLCSCTNTTGNTTTEEPQITTSANESITHDTSETSEPTSSETTEPQDNTIVNNEEQNSVTIDGLNISIKCKQDVGTADEANGVKIKKAYYNNDIGFSYNEGPFLLNVNGIRLSTATVIDNDTADILEVKKDADFSVVVFDVTVENTSQDDLKWPVNNSIITTNTKEQESSSYLFSDNVGGDFYGNVKKSGFVAFLLKNSVADDISHINWRIEAPYDSDYDDIADDFVISIDIVK